MLMRLLRELSQCLLEIVKDPVRKDSCDNNEKIRVEGREKKTQQNVI